MLQQIFHDKCLFIKQAVAIDTHFVVIFVKNAKTYFYVFYSDVKMQKIICNVILSQLILTYRVFHE
jgi:hypothetical protein